MPFSCMFSGVFVTFLLLLCTHCWRCDALPSFRLRTAVMLLGGDKAFTIPTSIQNENPLVCFLSQVDTGAKCSVTNVGGTWFYRTQTKNNCAFSCLVRIDSETSPALDFGLIMDLRAVGKFMVAFTTSGGGDHNFPTTSNSLLCGVTGIRFDAAKGNWLGFAGDDDICDFMCLEERTAEILLADEDKGKLLRSPDKTINDVDACWLEEVIINDGECKVQTLSTRSFKIDYEEEIPQMFITPAHGGIQNCTHHCANFVLKTPAPTNNPTPRPTKRPTKAPTKNPTPSPTKNPTPKPTIKATTASPTAPALTVAATTRNNQPEITTTTTTSSSSRKTVPSSDPDFDVDRDESDGGDNVLGIIGIGIGVIIALLLAVLAFFMWKRSKNDRRRRSSRMHSRSYSMRRLGSRRSVRRLNVQGRPVAPPPNFPSVNMPMRAPNRFLETASQYTAASASPPMDDSQYRPAAHMNTYNTLWTDSSRGSSTYAPALAPWTHQYGPSPNQLLSQAQAEAYEQLSLR